LATKYFCKDVIFVSYAMNILCYVVGMDPKMPMYFFQNQWFNSTSTIFFGYLQLD